MVNWGLNVQDWVRVMWLEVRVVSAEKGHGEWFEFEWSVQGDAVRGVLKSAWSV